MKISVITAVYNSERTIERNVLSVLSQSYRNFEHILADNLSGDNTVNYAKELYQNHDIMNKLIILSERDNGISDAFNKGIKAASGEIVGILNSDDAYYNDKVFEKVIEAFQNKNVLFAHGDMYFDDPVYGSNIRKPLLCPVTSAMPYNHPSMFFRKSVYEQYGMFNPAYKYAMDHELVIRYNKLIPGFSRKGKYIEGDPLVIMYSGGTSWKNEIKAINESKTGLIKNGMWDANAKKEFRLRIWRTRLKIILNSFGLNFVVRLWRKNKWG
jgi:glycosyltransferase involved in cell wall biosynthesis